MSRLPDTALLLLSHPRLQRRTPPYAARLLWPWAAVLTMLDRVPFNEGEFANFGLVGSLAGLLGLMAARKDKRLWPLMACSIAGLVFALGPVLKWSGDIQSVAGLRPLNSALWWLGRHIKPARYSRRASRRPAWRRPSRCQTCWRQR